MVVIDRQFCSFSGQQVTKANILLYVILVSRIRHFPGWKILHFPCCMSIVSPLSCSWTILNKLFFNLGTKKTHIIICMILCTSIRTLPLPYTLWLESFPNFIDCWKLPSILINTSLLLHTWLLHPESRNQIYLISSSLTFTNAINNISSFIYAKLALELLVFLGHSYWKCPSSWQL
jgi:hypothetical protein